MRSALPDAFVDPPGEARHARDRIVDAVMYLVAFAISTATLVDTWELHPPWLRPVAVVAVIATVVSLRWRRTHPGAVGIGVAGRLGPAHHGAVRRPLQRGGPGSRSRSGHRGRPHDRFELHEPAALPRPSEPRARVRRRPGARPAPRSAGGSSCAPGAQLVRSLREQADRAGDEARAAERRRIAREMHDVLAHRLSLLSVHAGALEFRPDAPPEEVAEAAGVIRESARAALEDLRGVIGVLREDSGESLTQPPAADPRRPRRARRGVAGGRDADHGADRARRRGAERGRRAHRVPDRAGGPDQRAQARAGSGRDAHRPVAPTATCGSRSAASRRWPSPRDRRCPGPGPA